MSIRVVLDTNVFISGIFWEGNYCSQIIDAWRAGKITIISSLEIVQELVETLQDFRIAMPEEMIEAWRKRIIENAALVVPMQKIEIVTDPDDNKFFEVAIAGKAQYLVSQDKAVLKIGEYRQIKTIAPADFLKIL